MFYESRLKAVPGLERQEIRSRGRVRGTGLRYVPAGHQGNQNSSPEEAEVIRELVAGILGSPTSWIDRHGTEHAIGLNDILIIAPYNAQVFELQDRVPGGRIGTVRSEEHTSELQSQSNLVCRLLLEKKKKNSNRTLTRS